jgi:hypothetical protein
MLSGSSRGSCTSHTSIWMDGRTDKMDKWMGMRRDITLPKCIPFFHVVLLWGVESSSEKTTVAELVKTVTTFHGNRSFFNVLTRKHHYSFPESAQSNLSFKPRVPPLWSSCQSFWLLTQGSRVSVPALPDFSEQQWVWNGVHSASWTIRGATVALPLH